MLCGGVLRRRVEHSVEFDGGLGMTVHVDGGRLEIRTETGTRTLGMDDVVRTAAKGGRWSSRGTLEVGLSGGETVTVPFTRENRAQALQLRKRIKRHRLRAEGVVEVHPHEIEAFRQRRLQEIERERQLYADKAARGEITIAAHEAFEREAANIIAVLEKTVREVERATRRAEGENPNHA